MSDLAKLMAPIARRLGNMLARGSVATVNAGRKMQSMQLRLMADETKDEVEHVEPYGFTAHPRPGAEAIAAFFDGDRSHGVVLVVADRRYRLRGLEAGEVAIHDDQGQKVHLTRDGIVIDGGGLPMTITNAPTVLIEASTKIRCETPLLEVTGDIRDRCDSYGGSLYQMRLTYNGHNHPENNTAGGSTNQPNQAM